jgi:hypothetical protein
MGSFPKGNQNQFIQNPFIQEAGTAAPVEAENVNDAVPYRSKPLEYGLQLLSEKGLSRTHRRIFLLVDGARSVRELMRLLNFNEKQVLTLLYDLQDAGVINLPVPLTL